MPDLLFSARGRAGETLPMAKKKRTPAARPKPRAPRAVRPVAEVHEPRNIKGAGGPHDDLAGIDPYERLAEALRLVEIDPNYAVQPDIFWREQWRHGVHLATDQTELLALAVAHAEDARACLRRDMSVEDLRREVLCTLYLQRNRKPPDGLQDDRRALIIDGEVIALVQPGDDAKATHITIKLPRLLVDRLRDAVHAMAPMRTISGIAARGITTVLDQLEAEHIKNTGHGFPKLGGRLHKGGRPSLTRPTTDEQSTTRKKPRK